ncbi:hypothetical protein [Umezawaea beigongshangensis]|uniref:hypothetical protein n=1 Tax=Umezawaea beigongshangensis TaxID=2780383 RepID=UPI0018F16C95|nr:hypothetical protein [Umezawaea beigongshangensis]
MTSASDRARTVVGLYGDPDASWSILLEAQLTSPVDAPAVLRRVTAATAEHPHLGVPPPVLRPGAAAWPDVRASFADLPHRPGDPLLRLATTGDRLLIAAHHGAVDGLGLLALLGLALGEPVRSEAAGVRDATPARSFALSAVRRLGEALFAPPARIAPRDGRGGGDVLVSRRLPRRALGTARLAVAAAATTRDWNAEHGARSRRVVAGIGAARRGGAHPVPRLDSTFFRLPLDEHADESGVRALLAAAAPEPDFPPSSSRVARAGIRALSGRLGSTFLVSNLGVVHAGGSVRSLAFHPAATGRSGVAFGAVTTGGTTTVTLRARRRDFGDAAAAELLDRLVRSCGACPGADDAAARRG